MDQIIKKKLTKNWFKTLQEVFCKEIEELEGKSNLIKHLKIKFLVETKVRSFGPQEYL